MFRDGRKPIHVGRKLRLALWLVYRVSFLEWERYGAWGLNNLRARQGLNTLGGRQSPNTLRGCHNWEWLSSLCARDFARPRALLFVRWPLRIWVWAFGRCFGFRIADHIFLRQRQPKSIKEDAYIILKRMCPLLRENEITLEGTPLEQNVLHGEVLEPLPQLQ